MQCQQHNSITLKSISGSPEIMTGALRAQASAHPVTLLVSADNLKLFRSLVKISVVFATVSIATIMDVIA